MHTLIVQARLRIKCAREGHIYLRHNNGNLYCFRCSHKEKWWRGA